MQYLQVISGLLCDDLLFTIDGFSSPLVKLADGYEIGELVVTLFPVSHDCYVLGDEISVAKFAQLLMYGL